MLQISELNVNEIVCKQMATRSTQTLITLITTAAHSSEHQCNEKYNFIYTSPG